VIKPHGAPELYHYCPRQKSFTQVQLDTPPDIIPLLDGYAWLTGRFIAANYDQLLVGGEKGFILIRIDQTGDPCGSKSATLATIRILWRMDQPVLDGVTITEAGKLVCGDLNGDQRDELVIFEPEGSWKLLQFSAEGVSTGKWIILATGEEYKVKEWNPHVNQFRVMAAPFLSDIGQDILLTTFRNNKTGKYNYSLLKYLPSDQKFIPVFPDRQGSNGLTIGFDTLKPSDQFYPFAHMPGKPPSFLRYNRDWRFDLKEMEFNDTTFHILETIDFSGFPGDQNPKYYEKLVLYTGNWIESSTTSVMVIARNCKDNHYSGTSCTEYEELPGLPSTLQIYSFGSKK